MEAIKETILIIEDDAGLMELLNERIQERGFLTAKVSSAEKAFDWLKNQMPTLIVLDYSLPDMNGKEFLAGLMTRFQFIPPFILATGQGDERIAVDMMKLGARDYIVKDNSFLELMPIVISNVCKEVQNENKIKQIEQALIESNQFNKQIIACSQEGIVVYDKNLRYQTWNPFMENLTGMQASDVIGKHILDIYPDLKDNGVMTNIENAFRGIIENDIEFLYSHPVSKKTTWVTDTISILRNADNEIIGAISTIRNITKRKMAESERNQSREDFIDLFDNAPIGYHEIDADGRITRINQTELDMLGYKLEELIGQYIWSVAHNVTETELRVKEKLKGHNILLSGFETTLVNKIGFSYTVLIQDKVLRDAEGNITGIRSTIQDITERKKAENALKQSKDVLNNLLHASTEFIDSNSDGINYSKLTDTLLLISGAKYGTFNLFNDTLGKYKTIAVSGVAGDVMSKAKSIFGYDILNKEWKLDSVKEEIIKNNVIKKFDTIYELAKNALPNSATALIEKTFNVGETYVVKIAKGDKLIGHFVLIFTEGNTIQNNEIIELFANQVALYIDREKADNSLRSSEEKYRYLFANNPQPMYICDVETLDFLEVNKSLIDSYGYSREEFLGMKITDIRPKEDIPELLINVHDVNKKHNLAGEWRHVKKDGSVINVDIITVSIIWNGRRARHVLIQDITLRKKAEEALRESEDKYRTIIEYSNDLIWALDSYGNFTFVNSTSGNTIGLVPMEWIGKSFVSLVMEEDLPMLHDVLQRSMDGENCTYELRFKKADGLILIIAVNTSPIYSNGKIDGVVSFGRDITQRKMAEEALRASEELYRNLVQRIPDGVYKSTNEGKFVDVNPAMIQMLGYESKDELMNINIKTQLYFDETDRESLVLEEMHEETGVYQLKKKDGSAIWIEDHGWYNVDEVGNILFHEGVLRDITERKLSELALQEKMDELLRFHNLTIDRELRMIELKKEINRILVSSGQPSKYKIVE